MNTLGARFGLVIIISVVGVVAWGGTVAFADVIRFKQFVAPLECVKEVVNDGVSEEVILSPQECDELLHPKPPVDNGGGETGPSHPGPVATPNPSPHAPNTGGMQRFMDAVHDAGVIPVGLMILLALGVRKAYRTNKP